MPPPRPFLFCVIIALETVCTLHNAQPFAKISFIGTYKSFLSFEFKRPD